MHTNPDTPPPYAFTQQLLRHHFLLYLATLGLAPLLCFLGPYLDGAGVLPGGSGLLVGGASMFILPWFVAAAALLLPFPKEMTRALLVICALVTQGVLIFTLIPPSITSEMMGIAHRLRREFSTAELRDSAADLRRRLHDGLLAVSSKGKDEAYFITSESAVVVSDGDLPASLRGRFKRVFIQKGANTDDEQVLFALGTNTGIICDSRPTAKGFYVCSMAEGVHAYRYQRP